MWCVAQLDQTYIERMEDVLKLYEKPLSARVPVVCLDEKPVLLHADTRPVAPLRAGHVARRDLRVQTMRNGQCVLRRRGQGRPPLYQGYADTFIARVRRIPARNRRRLSRRQEYPPGARQPVHPHRKAVTDWFGERDGDWLWKRFSVHYTPKHGSWLNQAEIDIGLFSRQCLGKRRIASLEELTTEAAAWNQRTNQNQTVIEWKFTRKKARLKLKYTMMRSRY